MQKPSEAAEIKICKNRHIIFCFEQSNQNRTTMRIHYVFFFTLFHSMIFASGFGPILMEQRRIFDSPKNRKVLQATRESTAGATRVNDELLDLFNHQITNEFALSHLYLAASNWFNERDFEGMTSYMHHAYHDERKDANDFIEFARQSSFPIELEYIEAQDASGWSTPEEVWDEVFEAQKENTQTLLDLADAATNCKNHAVIEFLMPYHAHQLKIEQKIRILVAKVQDEAKTPGMLRQLDGALKREEVE